jgi:hypothetical protein
VKKNPWERIVTSDGYAPLLFYLMVVMSVMLAGLFLQFWVKLGVHGIGW